MSINQMIQLKSLLWENYWFFWYIKRNEANKWRCSTWNKQISTIKIFLEFNYLCHTLARNTQYLESRLLCPKKYTNYFICIYPPSLIMFFTFNIIHCNIVLLCFGMINLSKSCIYIHIRIIKTYGHKQIEIYVKATRNIVPKTFHYYVRKSVLHRCMKTIELKYLILKVVWWTESLKINEHIFIQNAFKLRYCIPIL